MGLRDRRRLVERERRQGQRQAPSRSLHPQRRQTHRPPRRGPSRQPRLRHGTSFIRHEQLLRQSSPGPNRTLEPSVQVRDRRLYASQEARRGSCRSSLGASRRQTYHLDQGSVRISRYSSIRTLQARPLPILNLMELEGRCTVGKKKKQNKKNTKKYSACLSMHNE